jgi:hypothetical protein
VIFTILARHKQLISGAKVCEGLLNTYLLCTVSVTSSGPTVGQSLTDLGSISISDMVDMVKYFPSIEYCHPQLNVTNKLDILISNSHPLGNV